MALLNAAGRDGRVLHRDDIYGSGPPVDAVHGELLDFVARNAGRRILDIGCGIAPYVAQLKQRGFDCVGVELDESIARAAAGLGRPVMLMDGVSLAWKARSFDTCILIDVIEHIDDLASVLLEAGRVARKNLIISVPNIDVLPYMCDYHVVPWHLLESTHVNFFTPGILETKLRQLFPGSKVFAEPYSPFFPYAVDREFYFQARAVVSF